VVDDLAGEEEVDEDLLDGVKTEGLPDFDDGKFAMALLEKKHVLIVPGS
jgi:aspartate/methionine/tyrosine aminotransferase